MDIPVAAVRWHPCYRIVPSRFPPIALFEAVADPADLDAVFLIEAMTNDRLREEAGDLALVPIEDRVSGPGTSPIMAAFTHLNPLGDRFTDGSYGVFYASLAWKPRLPKRPGIARAFSWLPKNLRRNWTCGSMRST